MKKILYANGDSFTFGMECLGDFDRTLANRDFAFPKHIGDYLNCDQYINNAYNGASNDHIFKRTIVDLLELERQGVDPRDVFVIVGWSSLHRIEIDGSRWLEQIPDFMAGDLKNDPSWPREYTDFGVIFANPGSGIRLTVGDKVISVDRDIIPFCTHFLWTDVVQIETQEARIIALHELLKAKGYDHVFASMCHPFLKTRNIDSENKNFYNITTSSFYDFAIVNYPTELRKHNHFTTVVHEKYAEKLFEYITKNCIS